MAFVDIRKNLQELIGEAVPNGILINGILGFAQKLVLETYLEADIIEAKKILVDLVKESPLIVILHAAMNYINKKLMIIF